MRRFATFGVVTASLVALVSAVAPLVLSAQRPGRDNTEAALPNAVDPESRNRLPARKRDGRDDRGKRAYDTGGAAAIRLHGSGANVRWSSAVGRQLTELAILTTAREHDQPYEWSLHE